MRLTLNHTRVFGEQESGAGRAQLMRVVCALALAAVAALAGCRGSRRPPASQAPKGTKALDLATPRAEPPPAQSLPDPASVALPARAPAGTLRVHLDAEPTHLHPLVDDDASVRAITAGLVYQTLLDCSSGSYRPLLAESWDVSDDGMRIAVRVRSGVRWHDHRAFGVLDVQATLEPLLRSSGQESAATRADLADVAGVELVTERTIRLVLKRPSDLALRALCDIPMLPQHLIEGVRPEASPIAKQPIGTGPFRFVSWERGKRIRLQRAPEAWGPPVGVDEIVFDVDPDAVRALNRTRRGDLDVLPRVLDVHYPDQVEPATLHGTTALYRLEPDRYSFLVANHRHYPLSDPRFRRAIARLWDRQRFAHELYKDLARPIGGPTFAGDVAAPAFDRKRAAALLDDAGYVDTNADGVRDRDGHPIRLVLLATAGSRPLSVEARAFVLEMRRAGILVDVVSADGPTMLARLRRGDFDLAPMIWQGRPDEDPSALYGPDGAFNYSGYRSSALDAALDDLRRAPGIAARRPVLARIGALVAEDQPVIFLYRYDVPALVATRVHALAAVGDRLDFTRVWLDP